MNEKNIKKSPADVQEFFCEVQYKSFFPIYVTNTIKYKRICAI